MKVDEKKWQDLWEKKKIFQAQRSQQKKLFITVPYPYTSGPLHIGHGRTYTLADIWARYQRMKGYNVLFPMAFHISGTPILAVADKIKQGNEQAIALYRDYISLYEKDEKKIQKILSSFSDPKEVAGYFSKVISQDFKSLGFSIDWGRSFTTGDPHYNRFIEWQFLCLKEKGMITRGSHPVQYCPRDDNPVGEDDIRDGDIQDTRIETATIIKFPFKDGFLPALTVRPETIFGVTNIWINPEGEYVKAKVDGEFWYLSREGLEKLGHQGHAIEKLGGYPGQMLLHEKSSSPVDDRPLPLLPALFVDTAVGTGVVFSVPAHSPDDYIALREMKFPVEPIAVVQVQGYKECPAKELAERMGIQTQQDREKLKEATKKLYKDEFYNGILANSGEFSGQPIKKVKEEMKTWLKNSGRALEIFVSATPHLQCRCGEKVVVKVLPDQWFINYGNPSWKELARECLKEMSILPEMYRASFEGTIEWLHERPCARKRGLGTNLPWDPKWVIDSLSDSTLYPAFYTLAAQFKKIPPQKLTPQVFDYLFLGKGTSIDLSKTAKIPRKTLEEMRKEFEYWYPVDVRHTAIPHLSNHLTFYIFNHAILLPKQYWPKMISLNELLIRDGSKMSKSKGNVIPLTHIAKHYSADLYRLYIAYSADMNAVVDWTEEGIEMVKKRLAVFSDIAIKGKKGKQKSIDRWLLSRFHSALKEIEAYIEQFSFRKYIQRALFEMMNDVSYYERREGKSALPEIMKEWIKILSPVIPHTCEELWKAAGSRTLVSVQPWPQKNENLINPSMERGEEMVRQTVDDIKEIEKIIQKKPKKVHIYVSPSWKYSVYQEVKESGGKEFSVKNLMENPQIRKQGKAAIQFAEKIRKEFKGHFLSEKEEYDILCEAKRFFEKECGCEVKVFRSAEAVSQKALKAEPGKPGIEIF